MKRTGVFLAALAMSALGAAPAFAANVYETLKSNPQFSTLTKIIEANDLKFRYTEGSITVFAPTDEALANQPGGIERRRHSGRRAADPRLRRGDAEDACRPIRAGIRRCSSRRAAA